MSYYLLFGLILIVFVGIYVWYQMGMRGAGGFGGLEGFASLPFSLCQNKGFSKEHCLTRFNPGVGETPSGWLGKVMGGSRGSPVIYT